MPSFRLWVTKNEIIAAQRKLIFIHQRETENWKQAALSQARLAREIALAARLAVERPEIDLREDFEHLLREAEAQVARLEEHVL